MPSMKLFMQLHQPVKLQSLATKKITEWIILQGRKQWQTSKELLSQQIEILRCYFKNIPGKILNNIFDALMDQIKKYKGQHLLGLSVGDILNVPDCGNRQRNLSGHVDDRFPIKKMIKVLFNKNLSIVSLSESETRTYEVIFWSNSNLLSGLNTLKLDLTYDSFGNNIKYAIIRLLTHLRNVNHLILTWCEDYILRHIAENCKAIEELDIHDYYFLNLETICKITQMSNLKTVNLFEPRNDGEITKEIVDRRSSILNYISSIKQFKIKSFVFCKYTEPEDLLLVTENYPDIESIEFLVTHRYTIKRNNMPMRNLMSLKSPIILKIVYKDNADQVEELIRQLGRKVGVLHLERILNMNGQVIKHIGEMCPYLESLTVKEVHFIGNDLISDTKTPLFKSLKRISLSNVLFNMQDRKNTSQLNTDQLISLFLLKNCPNIETIDVNHIEFTNDFMMEVLNENPMTCLRELRVFRRLDDKVIERFIENGLAREITFYCESSNVAEYDQLSHRNLSRLTRR